MPKKRLPQDCEPWILKMLYVKKEIKTIHYDIKDSPSLTKLVCEYIKAHGEMGAIDALKKMSGSEIQFKLDKLVEEQKIKKLNASITKKETELKNIKDKCENEITKKETELKNIKDILEQINNKNLNIKKESIDIQIFNKNKIHLPNYNNHNYNISEIAIPKTSLLQLSNIQVKNLLNKFRK